jgi:hypothetical protein
MYDTFVDRPTRIIHVPNLVSACRNASLQALLSGPFGGQGVPYCSAKGPPRWLGLHEHPLCHLLGLVLPSYQRRADKPHARTGKGRTLGKRLPMETKGKEKALGGFGAGNGDNAVSLASVGDMRERER